MPEMYAYGGTVTFDPNLTLQRKDTKIESFPRVLSQHLSYKGDRRYYLIVAKEYHKVDGEDDYEAPHLHFILYSDKLLPMYRVRAIQNVFKQTCGRSQFYMMTRMKTDSYAKYIKKDSERLYQKTGQHHYYEMNLENPHDEFVMYDLEDDDNLHDDL